MLIDLGNSLVKLLVDLLIEDLIDELIGAAAVGDSGELLAQVLSNGLDLALDQIGIEFDLSLGSS